MTQGQIIFLCLAVWPVMTAHVLLTGLVVCRLLDTRKWAKAHQRLHEMGFYKVMEKENKEPEDEQAQP